MYVLMWYISRVIELALSDSVFPKLSKCITQTISKKKVMFIPLNDVKARFKNMYLEYVKLTLRNMCY